MGKFCDETNTNKNIKRKIMNALEHNAKVAAFSIDEQNEFLKELPVSLKFEISNVMYKGVTEIIQILKNKDKYFIAELIPRLKPFYVKKGQYIYQRNNKAHLVYFILSGKVFLCYEVLSKDPDAKRNIIKDVKALKKYTAGSYFGEIEILFEVPREFTVRAEMNSNLLTISKNEFLKLLNDFPEVEKEFVENAKVRQEKIQEAIEKIKILDNINAKSRFWKKKRTKSFFQIVKDRENLRDFVESSDEKIMKRSFSFKEFVQNLSPKKSKRNYIKINSNFSEKKNCVNSDNDVVNNLDSELSKDNNSYEKNNTDIEMFSLKKQINNIKNIKENKNNENNKKVIKRKNRKHLSLTNPNPSYNYLNETREKIVNFKKNFKKNNENIFNMEIRFINIRQNILKIKKSLEKL